MAGACRETPNHGVNHYRCRFPAEYALANKVDHPKAVYLKESSIVSRLDEWLAQLFDPSNLDETVAAMTMAGAGDESLEAAAEGARWKLADCEDRLAKYRAALDSGADPVVVAGWMSEVQGERLVAESQLAASASEPLTADRVRSLVQSLGEAAQVLPEADPKDKASVYSELGIRVTYHPADRRVVAEASPAFACATECVGGGA